MYFLLNPGVSIWTSNSRMLTVSPMFYIQLPHRFLIVWTRSQSHLENINSDETNCLPNTYMQQTSIEMYRIDAGPLSLFVCLFVCFITKSFLTYSFFPPTPALSTISRHLSSSMCAITTETANVCSSYNRMRGPGIGCWFSDRSNCSHWSFEAAVLPINPNIYTHQGEPVVMYHSITFTFTGPYTTM